MEYILCSKKKTRDHVFDDKLNLNCLFTKIFGILKRTIGHRQVFLFSHLTYLVQLLYLGKLSRRRYQQKLNIIMKISQEDVILIKNLYLSKQYGAQRLLRKLPDKGWKLWSIDSLPKRSYKTGTIIPLPGSVRPRLSRSSEKPCAQSGKQAKKASVSSLDFAWNCSSVHRKIIHCDLQLTCFKCCRAAAVVWSQSYIPSHSLINNAIVCNKSCYCSITNRKLYNK